MNTAIVAVAAILISAIQALLGFIMFSLRQSTVQNSDKIHQLERDVGTMRVEMAAEYVRKTEIQPVIDRLEQRFDKRFDDTERSMMKFQEELIDRFRHLESRIYQLATHKWDENKDQE